MRRAVAGPRRSGAHSVSQDTSFGVRPDKLGNRSIQSNRIDSSIRDLQDDGTITSSLESEEQARQRTKLQERAWDLVWWRQAVNAAIAVLCAFILVYPLLIRFNPANEFGGLRPISDAIRFIGVFLPAAAEIWINAYARAPGLLLISLGLVASLVQLVGRLKRSIRDRVHLAWRGSREEPIGYVPPPGITYRFRTAAPYRVAARFLSLHAMPLLYAGTAALVVLYAITIAVYRTVFVFEDANGWFCKSSSPQTELEPGQTSRTEFEIASICHATGVHLSAHQRYLIRVTPVTGENWQRGVIPISFGGLGPFSEIPTRERLRLVLAAPLRRVWSRPWFSMIAQIGEKGSEDEFLDPDPSVPDQIVEIFRPQKSGELFLYVNDVVYPAYPFDLYYRENGGRARVEITRR